MRLMAVFSELIFCARTMHRRGSGDCDGQSEEDQYFSWALVDHSREDCVPNSDNTIIGQPIEIFYRTGLKPYGHTQIALGERVLSN
jgi:hypothetical protein